VVNPARGSSLGRTEEQDCGPRPSVVERNKVGDGFIRLRWGETDEQAGVGCAPLTIETGADLLIGITQE
jgi:hypothetical protein